MKNQHKMIAGYCCDLTQADIDAINEIKRTESALGELWKYYYELPDVDTDKRWMSIAKTHFEEGFSAFVRAVAKPEARF